MAYTPNDSFWNASLNQVASVAIFVSAHVSDPGTTGTGETSGGSPAYARKSITWNTAAAGSITASNAPVFDIATGVSITYIGLWSASSGGTFYGSWPISTQTFSAQGTLTITSASIDK